jgi:Paf1 complex subunit CDC73 N-terminal
MDPLSLLREFYISSQLDQIEVKNDRIKFGEKFTFLKTLPTAYKSQLGRGEFYTLETLLFFLKYFHGGEPNPSFPNYMQVARSSGLPYVSMVDRKVRVRTSFLCNASLKC